MFRFALMFSPLLALGCDKAPVDTAGAPTWHADVRPIVEARCSGCHQADGIGPFALETFEDLTLLAPTVADSVAAGRMPPWKGNTECNDYRNDYSLRDHERDLLLEWLDGAQLEGDTSDYSPPEVQGVEIEQDLEMQLVEAYTPRPTSDDYRCLMMPWPEEEASFVTGYQVFPDQAALVHHVILFVAGPDDVAAFQAMDDADEGPGYACYGGPTSADAEAPRPSQLGGWIPGAGATAFPEDTGIEVQPGSMLIAQMHYNMATAEPAGDQTRMAFQLAEQVERPAVSMLLTDRDWLQPGGMPIPAGESQVTHETEIDLSPYLGFLAGHAGLQAGDAFAVHTVAFHMHELGAAGNTTVVRSSGEEDCLADIPEWDFHWQGGFQLAEEVTVQPGDALRIRCTWDNSAANQPWVDGEQLQPQDTEWGEGTRDEMCLSGVYFTAAR